MRLFFLSEIIIGINFAVTYFGLHRELFMKKLKVLLTITSIFALGFMLLQNAEAQSRTDRILINEAQRITNDIFYSFSQTPKGARVYSINQPSYKMLNAIDDGLTELFTVARKYNYRNRLNYSDYTIFIAEPDRTKDGNKKYSPDISIAAAQYADTVYDKGGYIYAAGIVMAFNPCAFIIAEHTKDFQRVSNVVRFEGEHLVLYHNDRKFYNKTADHSQGGGHPILQ